MRTAALVVSCLVVIPAGVFVWATSQTADTTDLAAVARHDQAVLRAEGERVAKCRVVLRNGTPTVACGSSYWSVAPRPMVGDATAKTIRVAGRMITALHLGLDVTHCRSHGSQVTCMLRKGGHCVVTVEPGGNDSGTCVSRTNAPITNFVVTTAKFQGVVGGGTIQAQ